MELNLKLILCENNVYVRMSFHVIYRLEKTGTLRGCQPRCPRAISLKRSWWAWWRRRTCKSVRRMLPLSPIWIRLWVQLYFFSSVLFNSFTVSLMLFCCVKVNLNDNFVEKESRLAEHEMLLARSQAACSRLSQVSSFVWLSYILTYWWCSCVYFCIIVRINGEIIVCYACEFVKK